MKNIGKYFAAVIALALVIPLFSGCDDLDEYTLGSVSAAPSDKFNATIQFVSRLGDGALMTGDADFTAVNNYMVSTLKKREDAWLTVLDRTDNAGLRRVASLSLNTYRWTLSSFYGMSGKTVFEGGTLYFNQPIRQSKALACGKGCYVTGFSPLMEGTRTDKDESGTVTGTADVAFNINFRTVRFNSGDQINAFGGENGVMNVLKRENMNMLLIGTVKNDLYAALESAVAGTDASFKVYRIAQGSAYSLFMLAEMRFWGYTGMNQRSLGNGIDAYEINVMW